jgi:hypothetical protein
MNNNESLSKNEFDDLSVPIDNAILLCDNEFDLLKLACVMLQRTQQIFDTHLGVDGRKQMFKDLV